MIRILLFFFMIGNHLVSIAQDSLKVQQTLIFLGDGGEPTVVNDPVGEAVNDYIMAAKGDVTVIYLGDNIYPAGLPDPENILREQYEKVLQAQVQWTNDTHAKSIFIPGNHDWSHWGKRGYEYVMNQQSWFDSLKNENIIMLPRNGCPGPVTITKGKSTVLIILDTQWILHRHMRPGVGRGCNAETEEDVYGALEKTIKENIDKRIVIAGHHPLITYGEHGGYFPLRLHIFPLTEIVKPLYIPLPIIGSIYPLYRKYIGHYQDTKSPRYRRMSKRIQQIMSASSNVLYVAGHEHALQYIVKDDLHFVVSGSASKTERVKKKGHAKFADDVRGFVTMKIFEDGSSSLHFFRADHQFPKGHEIYTVQLPELSN